MTTTTVTTATETRAMSRKAMLRAAGMTEDQCNAARASAGLAPMAPIVAPAAAKAQARKPAVATAAASLDPRALSRASMEREIKKASKLSDDDAALLKTGRR